MFLYFFRLSTRCFIKKDFLNNLWLTLQYYFQSNILRHHREKKFVKLGIKQRVGMYKVTDSLVWCTQWSQNPRYDARCEAWLHWGMHTADCRLQSLSLRWDARGRVFGHTVFCFLDTAVGCTLQSFLKILISRWNSRMQKYFSLLISDPDGFKSWKNSGQKFRHTLPLRKR